MVDTEDDTTRRGERDGTDERDAGDSYGSISRRHFVGTGVATGAVALGVGSTAVSGQTDDETEPVWFETAQTEHPVDSYHYNYTRFGGTTHAGSGIWSQYTLYDWEYGEFIPHLVRDWDATETEFVLTLRDDVTWEDGEPVDAEALAFQWEVLEATGHRAFEFVVDVEATGEYELTFRYPEGTNATVVEHAVLHESADMPPQDWQGFLDDPSEGVTDYEVPEPTASGPLTLTEQDDNYHQFEPRDRVEGVDDHPFAGNYDFDGYRMRYREDNQAAHQSFIDQELDGIHSLFTSDTVLGRFPDSVEEITFPGTFGMGMAFNHEEGPFTDRAARQAVAHSIDLESVILSIGEDKKIYHEAQTGLTANAAEEWLGSTAPEGFETYEQDLGQVDSLLEEAGLTLGEVNPEFVVPAGWSDWILMASSIADQMALGGWDVDLNTLGGAYWSARGSGDFDVIAAEHSDGPAHNDPYASLAWKLNAEPGSIADVASYDADAVDLDVEQALTDLASTQDEAEQVELIEELALVVNRDLPYLHVAQKYEQSFIDRESWDFPENHELLRTQWPLWTLPKTDESLPEYDQPGLLKAGVEDGEDPPIDPPIDPNTLEVTVHGDLVAGADATVEVTDDGEPVEGATVTVNGSVVGSTGSDGQLEFEVPSETREFDLRVAVGADEVQKTYFVQQDPAAVDAWFETAQTEHPVDSYHYNYTQFAGTTHAGRGIWAQYTAYDWENGEFLPHLVQDWEATETEFVLTLRDDVTWEDGTPVDAEALAFQWDVLEESDHRAFEFVDGVEVTGEYELTFHYPEGTNTSIVEHAILHEQADMPPQDWQGFLEDPSEGITNYEVSEPTASGPLTLTEQTENYHQYEPRHRVRGADDHPFSQNYNFNGYRMRYREDNQAAHQSFIDQELDGMHSLFTSDTVLGRFPDSFEEITFPGTFGMGVAFNHEEGPFTERAARQAVAHSVDLGSVILTIGEDKKIHHEAQTGLTANAAEEWLGSTAPDGFETYEQDEERVQDLLEVAGLTLGEVNPEFVAPAGWSDWILMASVIADQMGLLGWEVDLSTLGGAYWSARGEGNFDVIAAQHSDGPEHNDPYSSLRWKLLRSGGNIAEVANYEAEEVDVDLEQAFADLASTQDEAEQAQLIEELALVVNRDLPYLHVAQKYEQSFIDRESWEFPSDHELLNVQWPLWMLPKTEESFETAETPGLLKATPEIACEQVGEQTVCDVDGDGNYRDVTGDGSVTNSDVTTFFGNQHASPWDDRPDLFDFDGSGDVGQGDVVDLFESLAE